MRIVLQRVRSAELKADGSPYSKIGAGLVLCVGFCAEDTEEFCERLAQKVCDLRIFSDVQGKMNLSVTDVGGQVLVVSNFTLYADARRGNRPSFSAAAKAEIAQPLYEKFVDCMRKRVTVQTGVFGADMEVSLVHDGPIVMTLDSEDFK